MLTSTPSYEFDIVRVYLSSDMLSFTDLVSRAFFFLSFAFPRSANGFMPFDDEKLPTFAVSTLVVV